MVPMLNLYIICFAAGFLLDKLRVFPFILGLIVGLVMKALIDSDTLFNGTEVVANINRIYTNIVATQDIQSRDSSRVYSE
jgi:hypothetical protein